MKTDRGIFEDEYTVIRMREKAQAINDLHNLRHKEVMDGDLKDVIKIRWLK